MIRAISMCLLLGLSACTWTEKRSEVVATPEPVFKLIPTPVAICEAYRPYGAQIVERNLLEDQPQ